MDKKIKLAVGLLSTCSGCDVAILDLHEKVLDLASLADIVFWPTAMDFKLSDLERFEKGGIDISLCHGVVRTSEHEHMARLMRDKSKLVVAFGSCACFGGIPGLCNLTSKDEIFATVYRDTASTVNPDFVTPQPKVLQNGHELTLPQLLEDGRALSQVVDVDYSIPGCPPAPELIAKLVPMISEFLSSGKLPPKGTVIASEKMLCDECTLKKENKMISRVYRPHEIVPDFGRCLLEQGLLCMGPATRGGCGLRCINAHMPCRGCMGPAAGVKDQGARMISAIASILGAEKETELSDGDVDKLIDQVKDPVGLFYRFSLPVALVNRKGKEGG